MSDQQTGGDVGSAQQSGIVEETGLKNGYRALNLQKARDAKKRKREESNIEKTENKYLKKAVEEVILGFDSILDRINTIINQKQKPDNNADNTLRNFLIFALISTPILYYGYNKIKPNEPESPEIKPNLYY